MTSQWQLKVPTKSTIVLETKGGIRSVLKTSALTPESCNERDVTVAVQGHPRIIRLIDNWETASEVVLQLEFHPRSLLDAFTENNHSLMTGFWNASRLRNVIRQIVDAVDYIHQKGYVHLDLKLENILIDHLDRIYIIDFGFASHFNKGTYSFTDKRGSLHYAAPEIWARQTCEGPELDVWSLGVMFFIMATSYFPFPGKTATEVHQSLSNYHLSTQLWMPEILKREPVLYNLICKMLFWRASERATLDEIKHHPWLEEPGFLLPLPGSYITFGAVDEKKESLSDDDVDEDDISATEQIIDPQEVREKVFSASARDASHAASAPSLSRPLALSASPPGSSSSFSHSDPTHHSSTRHSQPIVSPLSSHDKTTRRIGIRGLINPIRFRSRQKTGFD